MTKEIKISSNIEISEFRKGNWIIIASTET